MYLARGRASRRATLFATAVAICLLASTWIGAGEASGKRPRWTEQRAENALLSRAHISYADCLPLGNKGRRFLCLIEYTDGGEWYLIIVPQRDGYAVRASQPA